MVFIFCILINKVFLFGQCGIVNEQTRNPYVDKYSPNTKITTVNITEYCTVVYITVNGTTANQKIRFNSDSYIKSSITPNLKYKILSIDRLNLDEDYPLSSNSSYAIVFEKINPGEGLIDIVINPGKFEEMYYWAGVTINNPPLYKITSWDEQSLKQQWEQNGFDLLEGIYEDITITDGTKYRLGLKKEGDGYDLIYISGEIRYIWKTGEIKAKLYPTATPLFFKCDWFLLNKQIAQGSFVSFENGLMKLQINDTRVYYNEYNFIKIYPTSSGIDGSSKGIKASGTGFAFASNGLIITNNHVIEGASKIHIKGINGNFDKSLKAKLILNDKNNDLAIIKVDDPAFSSLGKIPYLIKELSSNVGENIFVLGYPLRSSMGDEIKLTNGIISSKTGFQGDITSYQISAPVQPGNSGGPLFDKNGDLIGIINSKHKDAENVSYAIKVKYLKNLFDLLDAKPVLPTTSLLYGKTLTQQVEMVKKFVYIIEVE